MGFCNLHGIEIQSYALEKASVRLPGVYLHEAAAFDIPYSDNYFDLVFTSGVLIHIAPGDLSRAVKEIHRCSRSYIWGLEYHAPQATEVNYRGHDQLFWKMDYAKFYLEQFKDLELVKSKPLPYLKNNNIDLMFLLRKTSVCAQAQFVAK